MNINHTISKKIRKEELADGVVLFCGNCISILPTLGKIDAIITDPPYEDVMQRHFGQDRVLQRKGFKTDLNFDAVDNIREDVVKAIVPVLYGWAIIFCMAEGVRAWRDCIEDSKARYRRAMVWVKSNPTSQFNGTGPGIGHEMMVSAWFGGGHSKWNGGFRVGNFFYPKVNDNVDHPTRKPLPLIRELVMLFSFHDQLVCDPFMGSGTTGVACIETGRRFIGIELNEKYFDLSCRRIEKALKTPNLFLSRPRLKQGALTPKYGD